MRYRSAVILLAAAVLGLAPSQAQTPSNAPVYTTDGKLEFPQYRRWVFLSSGMDMSYLPQARTGPSRFTNVFVNPESHEAFLATGTWPDKTVLVLEIRNSSMAGSINKSGRFQTGVAATEVHVKDSRLEGGWGFFNFGGGQAPAAKLPRTAECYSCHEANGAVDTTFVQFYPTLLPIAQGKQTLSPEYLANEAHAP